MEVEKKTKTFISEMTGMGYRTIFFAVNKEKNRVMESVNMNEQDMGFAIFKIVSDSNDIGLADVVIKAAMAAKEKLKYDKEVDTEVDDLFSKLGLK